MLHSGTMPSLLSSILDQVHLNTIVDIGITALLIYWLFKLIRGTRAVRLVIGVSVLVLVYGLALFFDLHLLSQLLQAGPVETERIGVARAADAEQYGFTEQALATLQSDGHPARRGRQPAIHFAADTPQSQR